MTISTALAPLVELPPLGGTPSRDNRFELELSLDELLPSSLVQSICHRFRDNLSRAHTGTVHLSSDSLAFSW
jgi:hypothetical protein